MIRVGHLIKGLGRGGAETLLPHLLRASRESQQGSVAYFLPWKDALVSEVRGAGGTVTCLGARSTIEVLLSLRGIRAWIRDHRLDVLHCHLPVSGAAGRLAARGTGVPVVYTEHNLQERYRLPTRWLNRITWGWQDRVVAVSDEVARSIASRLPNGVPVETVPNGIPDLPFHGGSDEASEFRRAQGLAGVPVVGTIAVFRQQKRLDLWLRAASRIRDRVPEVRFLVVGDGPEREAVDQLAAELGLADRTIRPGLQSNVVDWLGCMDVFMITSEFEGLPLALLEAMMSGIPVVATAVGGIPEVIRDGRNGCLIPFGAIDEQVEQVTGLLGSTGRRRELAAAGRATVRDEFGIDRMAARLDAIYREVLNARGASGEQSQ